MKVEEVSEGITARELGIYTPPGSLQTEITGADLNPVLLGTTRLENILGTKAQARLASGGANNDFIVTATINGAATATGDPLNGVTVQFATGGTAGAETAVYDPIGATLTITVEEDVSTAVQVVDAINNEQFVDEAYGIQRP